jgi:hypothetical protein
MSQVVFTNYQGTMKTIGTSNPSRIFLDFLPSPGGIYSLPILDTLQKTQVLAGERRYSYYLFIAKGLPSGKQT